MATVTTQHPALLFFPAGTLHWSAARHNALHTDNHLCARRRRAPTSAKVPSAGSRRHREERSTRVQTCPLHYSPWLVAPPRPPILRHPPGWSYIHIRDFSSQAGNYSSDLCHTSPTQLPDHIRRPQHCDPIHFPRHRHPTTRSPIISWEVMRRRRRRRSVMSAISPQSRKLGAQHTNTAPPRHTAVISW